MAKRRTRAERQRAIAKRKGKSFPRKSKEKKTVGIMSDIDVLQIKRDLLKTLVVTVIVLAVLFGILRYT